jgi:hypothetical protein
MSSESNLSSDDRSRLRRHYYVGSIVIHVDLLHLTFTVHVILLLRQANVNDPIDIFTTTTGPELVVRRRRAADSWSAVS